MLKTSVERKFSSKSQDGLTLLYVLRSLLILYMGVLPNLPKLFHAAGVACESLHYKDPHCQVLTVSLFGLT